MEEFDISLVEEQNENDLLHYGTPRHSGRYPWGSGENPFQHEDGWLGRYRELKAKGLSETDIASQMGISTTVLRNKRKAAEEEEHNMRSTYVKRMILKGYTPTTLSQMTGIPESTIRGLRDYVQKERKSQSRGTADMLIAEYKKKGWIDVGKGVDKELGITDTTLKAALEILKDEGYTTVNVDIEQINNPGRFTTVKVLCKEGTTKGDVFKNLDQIHSVGNYSPDFGKTYDKPKKPVSIDDKRVFIRYGDEGGSSMDGTIELRPGVADLTLGKNHYAQVRIGVNDRQYMKGMAFYSNDIPEGYDIVYNTNKPAGTPKEKVFKNMKGIEKNGEVDWDNPFGAVIRKKGQNEWTDENGEKHLSPINIIKQEGDWDSYSKSIASQMLSKQKVDTVKKQLKLTLDEKKDEYNDILNIQNPVMKSKFLKDYAEKLDSDATELKATAVPGQSSKVILPVNSLKDNEVYAPTYKDGAVLCLIRYPHAGVFEIPTLKVNNKNKEARERLGNATDAIGINTHVAGILSGADFDGDSVVVIPQSDKVKTYTKPPLKELEGWSEQMAILYSLPDDAPKMTDRDKGMQMGLTSNLITDMTIQGASDEEIVRAVKHSMVVIDAQKHHYDWKQSEKDHAIDALRKKYQSASKSGHGASTLISQASSMERVPQRSIAYDIDPETGAKIYRETHKTYAKVKKDAEGNVIDIQYKPYETKISKMDNTNDAFTLSSGTLVETAYAEYANELKRMANDARKQSKAIDISLRDTRVDPALKKEYEEEIASIKEKVNIAEANAPKERIAQVAAAARIREKKQQMPELKEKENAKDLEKLQQIALADARAEVGASKKTVYVHITDKERKAIEAGAISKTLLDSTMKNMNKDELREMAMPREYQTVPETKINRIKSMASIGYTPAQIAETLGMSASTVAYYANDLDKRDED